MKITALEEYGLRCMLSLAGSEADVTLSLPQFQTMEGLSIPYAAKLLLILRRAGLVKAVRGRRGGYMLARPAEKIRLKEIFDALGEPTFSSTHCGKHTGQLDICVHQDDCRVRAIWKSFDSFIGQILGTITLADVVSGKLEILDSIRFTKETEGVG
jgi:Rrf2 family iron-sulfur cluster assembly transcriptional regulator